MEEKHGKLVEIIQGLHDELRYKVQREPRDYMGVWTAHVRQCSQARADYATAMLSLATEVWACKQQADDRLALVRDEVDHYFKAGGFVAHIQRMLRKFAAQRHIDSLEYLDQGSLSSIGPVLQDNEQVRLLDVGSCYNPLAKFDYDVTAVDLSPATRDVLQCDFLTVNFGSELRTVPSDNNSSRFRQVEVLPQAHFHVVVFCLLLEYLPDSRLRLRAVHNAYRALKDNGLLVVITPDSKHAQKNMAIIQSWRRTLFRLGFDRVRYTKHRHLHCISFRKLCPVSCRLLGLYSNPQCGHNFDELCARCLEELSPGMLIHQDKHDYVAKYEPVTSAVETKARDYEEDLMIAEMLAEMPMPCDD